MVVAPIAAGEKVVASNDSQTARFIYDQYGDAVGVEMEGFGCLSAARMNSSLPAVVVRGISDLVEGKAVSDEEGWQPRAAQNAAAFTFALLRETFTPLVENANAASLANP